MSTTRSRSIDPLPLSRIRRELFDEPGVAAKIRRSYEISEPLVGLMLEQRVLDLLDQVEQDPERVQWSNNEVFERAVLAIASNSRSWSPFRRSLGALRDRLLGFDVLLVARVFEADGGQERITALRSLLRGLTSGRDTKAVIQFAQRLASVGGDYEHLKQVRRAYYQPFSATLDAR